MRQDDALSRRMFDPLSLRTSRPWDTCLVATGSYLLLGLLWVSISDVMLCATGVQSTAATLISIAKGSLFFGLTAPLLYWRLDVVLRRQLRANELLWAVADGTTDAVFVKNLKGVHHGF